MMDAWFRGSGWWAEYCWLIDNYFAVDTELHADSAKLEDVKAIVDEIAGLMAKIERLHKRGFRAEQQVLAVAERAASKQESKNLRVWQILWCINNIMHGWGGRGRRGAALPL